MGRDDPDRGMEEDGVSRRTFLKVSGLPLSATLLLGQRVVEAAGADIPVHGPGKERVTLTVNGRKRALDIEPRVTILDALRDELGLTGAKRVCDRGTCGSCTVLMDGKPVYACSILAIDAQQSSIATVESLGGDGALHPVQSAFVDNDAQQCGFCTPGFIVACKALLDRIPDPTPAQVMEGLGGNLCRCGTYVGVRDAVAQAAGELKGGRRG